ncbi:MAG: helix-turn-helix transcriptional regulator [Bryobacterales bacterium]|nr:helix-turn-helix transcriptional regulator [Bryobacterales bacterium]
MGLDVLLKQPLEPFTLDQAIDANRNFRFPLDPDFPLAIRLLTFSSAPPPYPLSWHERLEIFVPLAGHGVLAMGNDALSFGPGDVMVVDNQALHGIVEFQGPRRAGMTIYFMPSLVCGLGSAPWDSVLLTTFHRPPRSKPAIIRANDRTAASLHNTILRLARCYLAGAREPLAQAKCKIRLLEVLYAFASASGWADTVSLEHPRTQGARRIRQLHEYLLAHFSEKVSVPAVASVLGMSRSSFVRYFKRVTGQTFVAHLTQLRLERALQLLRETDLSIAEVSNAVGFSDQSYFDKTFRRLFKQSPREARRAMSSAVQGRESDNQTKRFDSDRG